jgi:hypothetical protein
MASCLLEKKQNDDCKEHCLVTSTKVRKKPQEKNTFEASLQWKKNEKKLNVLWR